MRKGIKYIVLLVFGALFLFVLNLCIGSVKISMAEIVSMLLGKNTNTVYREIIMEIRFPRAMAAFILGGALALSGYLLQTFFHNPIAGPFVLGISSGAKMTVALAMVYTLKIGISMNSWTMIVASFLGAMLSMGFVLILSKTLKHMSHLIVAGIMIGYICSAVTDFIVTFADDSNIVNLHNWTLGSFSGITWANVKIMTLVSLVCIVGVIFLSKSISAYQLGEAYAQNVGVNLRMFRVVLVILSSVLSACVTAFAGPISFVGIAVPHLMRSLLKTTKPMWMIFACLLGGGCFCLGCDFSSRMLFAPTELSISTITAVFGAPVVLMILLQRKRG